MVSLHFVSRGSIHSVQRTRASARVADFYRSADLCTRYDNVTIL